jgi:hypothetical protein
MFGDDPVGFAGGKREVAKVAGNDRVRPGGYRCGDGLVEIFSDPASLRDLARWLLALSDTAASPGATRPPEPRKVPLAPLTRHHWR